MNTPIDNENSIPTVSVIEVTTTDGQVLVHQFSSALFANRAKEQLRKVGKTDLVIIKLSTNGELLIDMNKTVTVLINKVPV